LKGSQFSSNSEIIAAAENWSDGKYADIFFECLAKFKARG